MEEIDIIELLKRVKEGKAPKKIEIDETEYIFYQSLPDITECYRDNEHNSYMSMETITLDTKIKILDKPIIEELKPVKYGNVVTIPDRDILMNKINEIIGVLNERNL